MKDRFSKFSIRLFFKISFVFSVFSVFSFIRLNEPSASQIVHEMFNKTKEIKTMSYTMKKKERISGEMQSQETTVKLNVNPFKMYLKQLSPKEGLEVLYVQGENDNKAIINTNGFPWMNVSLDPMGSVMRDNQHHTVYQSGYAHLMTILEHLTVKYHTNLESIMTRKGSELWDGQECWIITFTNPHFHYYKHTVKKGETVLTIAEREKLSEHMIMEKNPKLKDFDDVKPGQVIELPNDYSNKLELYIEKARFIPLVMKVYDEKGLYEYYEYTNVRLNPPFTNEDFNKDNSSYGF